MRYFLLILVLFTSLHASIKEEMFSLYQKKQYKKACRLGFNNFSRFKGNEELVSLYGFACLNTDYIDRLAIPVTALKSSAEARANASYFAVILMQKKMLYHALIDGYDLSKLKLPTTTYVLSKVFDFYAKEKKQQNQNFYIFQDKNDAKLSYKLYLMKDKKVIKMVIEEFYDKMLIKRHIYW